MRILIIEDDLLLGNALQKGLKQDGDIVDWIKDGAEGEKSLKTDHGKFDVVVLDISLPTISGFELLANIRSANIATPVLILTANELDQDRIKGLDLGADDYLIKPVDLEVLRAHLRALHRRHNSRAAPLLEHGDLVLDPASHIATYKNEVIAMPRREFALLLKLLENCGRVLSRDYLTQILYGWEDEIDSNALEVHIHNLRKKFGTNFIRTIRGVGYMIDKIS